MQQSIFFEYKSPIPFFVYHSILQQLQLTTCFFFFFFLIKLLGFKMETNQTQSDMCYIIVDGV